MILSVSQWGGGGQSCVGGEKKTFFSFMWPQLCSTRRNWADPIFMIISVGEMGLKDIYDEYLHLEVSLFPLDLLAIVLIIPEPHIYFWVIWHRKVSLWVPKAGNPFPPIHVHVNHRHQDDEIWYFKSTIQHTLDRIQQFVQNIILRCSEAPFWNSFGIPIP